MLARCNGTIAKGSRQSIPSVSSIFGNINSSYVYPYGEYLSSIGQLLTDELITVLG